MYGLHKHRRKQRDQAGIKKKKKAVNFLTAIFYL